MQAILKGPFLERLNKPDFGALAVEVTLSAMCKFARSPILQTQRMAGPTGRSAAKTLAARWLQWADAKFD